MLFAQRWPGPHAALVPHWQTPVAAQLSACAGSHATQVAPPAPQVVSERLTQVAPLQQPVHVSGSQTQTPLWQRCPPAQNPVPHGVPFSTEPSVGTSPWSMEIAQPTRPRTSALPNTALRMVLLCLYKMTRDSPQAKGYRLPGREVPGVAPSPHAFSQRRPANANKCDMLS
jgi:hypothetical protein